MFLKKGASPFVFKAQRDKEDPASSSSRASTDSASLLSENEIRKIRSRGSRSRFRCWFILLVAHFALFAVYLGTVVSLWHQVLILRKSGPQLVNSPAHEAIEWELHKYEENDSANGPFTGTPRDEIDQNWHDLINAENIFLEPSFMKAFGREDSGVAIPDGTGFIGTLNVYHELHCIKRIYQYTYPDVYPQDDSEAARAMNRQHKDHCLDFLRQSAMCHADVGVITFKWSEGSLVPMANATHHQCANWEKLDKWTKARTVDMMKPGWLIHPTKGPAYPEGEAWH
ncbi:hypothetical protein F4780DRAFT_635215 [Xylariomycetidae sp. FL0641]|nr:hypothetical protein F4780DRAFT_635215 [Xylariomycetidae sp. FL0641]